MFVKIGRRWRVGLFVFTQLAVRRGLTWFQKLGTAGSNICRTDRLFKSDVAELGGGFLCVCDCLKGGLG